MQKLRPWHEHGGWEPNSHKIPVFEATCYVVGTISVVVATYLAALWIIQQG